MDTYITKIRITTLLILLVLSPFKAFADVDAWPLLELEEDSTTVMYPLHVREGDFKMNFPFYYQTNEGRDTHYLWPFVKISDGKLTRVAPFYFSQDNGDYTIFPIMTRRNNESWWLIPPMYIGKNTKAIFPFYLKTLDDNYYRKHVLNYYHVKKPNEESKGLFPFYMKSAKVHKAPEPDSIFQNKNAAKGTIEKKTNMLWPLFSKKEERDLDGNILKRKRRFIVFEDKRNYDGSREFSFLGVVFRESFKGNKTKAKESPSSTNTSGGSKIMDKVGEEIKSLEKAKDHFFSI